MASTQNQAPHGEPRSVGTAYLLWVPSLLGVAGLHRFYTSRWGSGLLWLFTGGLCYVGSVVDLFLIPEQVRSFNRSALEPGQPSAHEPMTLSQSILVLARRRGTRGFTFNDAVLELGHPPEAIRPALESLMQEDCLHVINDLEGRIVYREP